MRTCHLKCHKILGLRARQFPLDAKTKPEIAADAGLELGILKGFNFSDRVVKSCNSLIDVTTQEEANTQPGMKEGAIPNVPGWEEVQRLAHLGEPFLSFT